MSDVFCKDCKYLEIWPCSDIGCPPDRCGSPKRNRTPVVYVEKHPVHGQIKYGGEYEDILCRDRNQDFACDWFVSRKVKK